MRIKFYLTCAGKSPVEELMTGLPVDTRLEVLEALSLLESGRRLEMPLSRNLSSLMPGLHELRFRDRVGQLRVFYFVRRADVVYVLHALRKKTRVISQRDINLILKRAREI